MSDETQELPQTEATETSEEVRTETPPPAGNVSKSSGGEPLPSWQYSEGVPGQGETPEWFMADKYKSVEEQAKAALELRRKLGSKAEDAPGEYQLDYEKYGLEADDPVLAEMNPFFKEINIPQKEYEKLVDKYVTAQTAYLQQEESKKREAFEAYAKENGETVSRVTQWVKNNFNESEQAALGEFLTSPERIEVLDKVRTGAPKSAPPTATQAQNYADVETAASIDAKIGENYERYQSDAPWRNMMQKKRREALLRERNQ